MLFTGAFTANRWRLTIGSKMGDKLSERCDKQHRSTIENGSQTSGRGDFTGSEGVLGNTSRWCITLDSYATLTLRLCVHGCVICIYPSLSFVHARCARARCKFSRKRWNSHRFMRSVRLRCPHTQPPVYDSRRCSPHVATRTRKCSRGCFIVTMCHGHELHLCSLKISPVLYYFITI